MKGGRGKERGRKQRGGGRTLPRKMPSIYLWWVKKKVNGNERKRGGQTMTCHGEYIQEGKKEKAHAFLILKEGETLEKRRILITGGHVRLHPWGEGKSR